MYKNSSNTFCIVYTFSNFNIFNLFFFNYFQDFSWQHSLAKLKQTSAELSRSHNFWAHNQCCLRLHCNGPHFGRIVYFRIFILLLIKIISKTKMSAKLHAKGSKHLSSIFINYFFIFYIFHFSHHASILHYFSTN